MQTSNGSYSCLSPLKSRERLAVNVAAGDDSLSREGEGWGEGDQKILVSHRIGEGRFKWSRNSLISLTLALSLAGEGVDRWRRNF
jgi:hypothetical protein